jgi:hypothetical protein
MDARPIRHRVVLRTDRTLAAERGIVVTPTQENDHVKTRFKVAAALLPAAAVPIALGVGMPAGTASAANCTDGITLINHYLSVGDEVTALKIAGYLILDMIETGCI